jgi:protoporphyrinogen oxidase
MKKRVDIIGGGASGLACAWYMAKLGDTYEIHVWEKDSSVGGLAGSFSTQDFQVEKFYHHIFKRDHAIQALIAEVGLSSELIWKPAATGAYYFQQPFRLSSPIDLLTFKPLKLWDRFRMGALVLHARTIKNWEKLDDISAEEYIKKISGDRVYSIVWEPLLRGKFGPYASQISAAWLWSKLVDRGSSRNKQGFEYLGYLKGGMGRLFEKIRAELTSKGHQVHTGAEVQELKIENQQVTHLKVEHEWIKTDWVIGAAQLPDLAKLLPESKLKQQFQAIPFLGNICLVLTLKQSLSDFYWTNITDPQAPFVGIVEQTNWAEGALFQGKHLVYISAYTHHEDERWNMDSESLTRYYLPHIQKIFPQFHYELILDQWLWTAPYAQPIVTTGYRKLIPSSHTAIQNFFISTMAQIYPNDRQVSNGVSMAKKLVEGIIVDE